MDYLLFLAHAGEDHSSTGEAVNHSIYNEWYIALLLFVAVTGILVALSYYIGNKSSTAAYLMLLACLLVGGISMYSIAPVVSIAALSGGFVVSMGSVFFDLKSDT